MHFGRERVWVHSIWLLFYGCLCLSPCCGGLSVVPLSGRRRLRILSGLAFSSQSSASCIVHYFHTAALAWVCPCMCRDASTLIVSSNPCLMSHVHTHAWRTIAFTAGDGPQATRGETEDAAKQRLLHALRRRHTHHHAHPRESSQREGGWQWH